jgi:hypothetical protein
MNPPLWWSDPWWRWFLTIALASLIVGIVTGTVFFLANWRINTKARRATERERRAAEREQRINAVVDGYVRIATNHPLYHQGIAALILAGVKRLQDSQEIQEALQRSAERAGHHPLGKDTAALNPSFLKEFFQEVNFDNPNVVGYKEAVAKYSAKS